MFCGFFWKLIYDFYLSKTTVQNCNLSGRGHVPTVCSGGNHGDVCVALGRAPAEAGGEEAKMACEITSDAILPI